VRLADKLIGDRVCERGRALNHGVQVWPLDITKRERSKFDIWVIGCARTAGLHSRRPSSRTSGTL
jgi:hypothetical protein